MSGLCVAREFVNEISARRTGTGAKLRAKIRELEDGGEYHLAEVYSQYLASLKPYYTACGSMWGWRKPETCAQMKTYYMNYFRGRDVGHYTDEHNNTQRELVPFICPDSTEPIQPEPNKPIPVIGYRDTFKEAMDKLESVGNVPLNCQNKVQFCELIEKVKTIITYTSPTVPEVIQLPSRIQRNLEMEGRGAPFFHFNDKLNEELTQNPLPFRVNVMKNTNMVMVNINCHGGCTSKTFDLPWQNISFNLYKINSCVGVDTGFLNLPNLRAAMSVWKYRNTIDIFKYFDCLYSPEIRKHNKYWRLKKADETEHKNMLVGTKRTRPVTQQQYCSMERGLDINVTETIVKIYQPEYRFKDRTIEDFVLANIYFTFENTTYYLLCLSDDGYSKLRAHHSNPLTPINGPTREAARLQLMSRFPLSSWKIIDYFKNMEYDNYVRTDEILLLIRHLFGDEQVHILWLDNSCNSIVGCASPDEQLDIARRIRSGSARGGYNKRLTKRRKNSKKPKQLKKNSVRLRN